MNSNQSMKQKITNLSGIPKDVTMGIPILTILGDMELSMENYSGIIEYTDNIIRIRTKNGQIIVCGKMLRINYYTNDEMKIYGRVDSIEFKH